MKLNETKIGDLVVVEKMELPRATMMRLKTLGMTGGTTLRILNKKSSGSVILSVRGTRLALGNLITRDITVWREVQ